MQVSFQLYTVDYQSWRVVSSYCIVSCEILVKIKMRGPSCLSKSLVCCLHRVAYRHQSLSLIEKDKLWMENQISSCGAAQYQLTLWLPITFKHFPIPLNQGNEADLIWQAFTIIPDISFAGCPTCIATVYCSLFWLSSPYPVKASLMLCYVWCVLAQWYVSVGFCFVALWRVSNSQCIGEKTIPLNKCGHLQ